MIEGTFLCIDCNAFCSPEAFCCSRSEKGKKHSAVRRNESEMKAGSARIPVEVQRATCLSSAQLASLRPLLAGPVDAVYKACGVCVLHVIMSRSSAPCRTARECSKLL